MNSVYFKPCALSQVSRRCSWRFHANFKSASRFLCNRPARPLKAFELLAVSTNFSVEDVWTSRKHRPDSRSSFSNFYTELDFSRHLFGKFLQDVWMTWQHVQTLPSVPTNAERSDSDDHLDAQPSCLDVVLFRDESRYSGKAVAEDHPDESNFCPDPPQPESEFV
jgi:hypothetical protein